MIRIFYPGGVECPCPGAKNIEKTCTMKKKNLFRRTYRLGKLCMLSGVLVFAACTKDATAELSANGPALRFDVGLSGAWTPGVSAASERSDTLAGYCSEVYTLRGPAPADTLFLHASVADGIESNAKTDQPQTRATPVETETFYDSFGALAYVYTGAWSDALTPDYMYNVEITEASGWTATDYNWPGRGKKIRFFAYAPYGAEGVVLSAQQTAGAPTITYTTPSAVADQKDLLVAAPAEMDGASAPDKTAALTFGHALTAVKFSVGDDMMAGRITKITLKNVYGKAVYNMGAEQWSGFTSSSSFTQTLSKEVDGTPDEEITSEEATFMMIPQTLPSGATIEVGYTDKLTNTARTLTASIAGTTWPVGRTVTYRISTTSISIASTFTITAPDEFTYAGGTNVYKVDSRGVVSRPNDPEKSVPLAWTAEFVEDDGAGGYRVIEQPEWITGFTLSGDGGTSAQSYNATVTAQTGSGESNPHNEALQKAESINSTSGHTPYNLSNSAGAAEVQNTANCYVINAPGQYSLPLVYGNAIKNGSTNTSAYTSSASGANVLQKFINHTGNAITTPYIYDNAGCEPDNATLVWQDSPELVTNVALSSDKHSLVFEVPQASIAQGNAIVAVRNASDQIMWSWHIWVTDYVPGLAADKDESLRDKSVTNYQGLQYTFMPVNLGWCEGTSASYAGRSVKVRFTQAETDDTQIIEITQTPYSVSTGGNAPFYQFGRKDPMLPSTGSGNTDKPHYYTDENLKFNAGGRGKIPVQTSILNPHIFYNYGSSSPWDWCSTTYNNLWSANNTGTTANDDPVVKTVYDPSPVGYHLPPSNAFTGFTYNGNNISGSYYGSQYNSPYTSADDFTTNGGWIFYCNKMNGASSYDPAGGTIFFPVSGYRLSSSGVLYFVVSRGYYWSAVPSSTHYGRSLYFYSASVSPLYYGNRAYGFAVRPVQE